MRILRQLLLLVGGVLLLVTPVQNPAHSQEAFQLFLPVVADQQSLYMLGHFPQSAGLQLSPWSTTQIGGTLYFSANCAELWLSDGTPDTTRMIKNLADSDQKDSCPQLGQFTNFGNRLFFAVYNSNKSFTLWQSDGTAAGTTAVRNFTLTSGDRLSLEIVVDTDRLYLFLTETSQSVNTRSLLVVSDGTTAGTRPIYVFGPTGLGSVGILNGEVIFYREAGRGAYELWASNGTADGTRLIAPVSGMYEHRIIADQLWFATSSGSYYALAISDGTTAGTRIVKSFADGRGLSRFTEINGTFYFSRYQPLFGQASEIWISDGSEVGTQVVLPNRSLHWLTGVGNTLYFSNGILHRYDESGTVTAITPDEADVSAITPYTLGKHLFFTAYSEARGYEPWLSDGTAAGTHMLTDVAPGSTGSYVVWMGHSDTTLFFATAPMLDNYQIGDYTLWALPLSELREV